MRYYRCLGCTTPSRSDPSVNRPTRLANYEGGLGVTRCPKCGGWAEFRGETRSGFPTDFRKPESDAGWIDPVYEPGVGRVGGTRKGTRLTERPNGGWVEGSTRRNFRRMDWDTGKWVPMWTDPGWEGWWCETNDRMFPELY